MIYSHDTGAPLTADQWDFNFEQLSLRYKLSTGQDMPVTLRRDLTRMLNNAEVDSNFWSLESALRRLEYGDGPYPVFDQTFAGAHFLDPRLTFSNPTARTYIKDGQLLTAAPGVPVFEDGALRLEPQATNMLKGSADLAGWTTSGDVSKSDSGVPALGSDKNWIAIKEGSAAGASRIFADPSASVMSGASVCTLSLLVKKMSGGRCVGFALNDAISSNHVLAFMGPSTGASLASAGVTQTVNEVSASAYRFVVSFTSALTTLNAQIRISDSLNGNTYAGDSRTAAYLFGAQLELGSTSTSYIPTTTSAATRAADNLSIQGQAFADVFNSVEGAIALDIAHQLPLTNGGRIMYLSDPSQNINDYALGVAVQPTGQDIALYFKQAGTTTSTVTMPLASTGNKIGIVWSGTSAALTVNGALSPAIALPASYMSSAKKLTIADSAIYPVLSSRVRHMRIFRQRPSDAQLQAWTAL